MATLVAYIIMDLLKGAPVYEAMLEKCYQKKQIDEGECHLIETLCLTKSLEKQVHEPQLAIMTYSLPPNYNARAKQLTLN